MDDNLFVIAIRNLLHKTHTEAGQHITTNNDTLVVTACKSSTVEYLTLSQVPVLHSFATDDNQCKKIHAQLTVLLSALCGIEPCAIAVAINPTLCFIKDGSFRQVRFFVEFSLAPISSYTVLYKCFLEAELEATTSTPLHRAQPLTTRCFNQADHEVSF